MHFLLFYSSTGLESLRNTSTQTGPISLLGNDAHFFNATLHTLHGLMTLTLRQAINGSQLYSVAFTVINPVEVQEIQETFLRAVDPLAESLIEQTGVMRFLLKLLHALRMRRSYAHMHSIRTYSLAHVQSTRLWIGSGGAFTGDRL